MLSMLASAPWLVIWVPLAFPKTLTSLPMLTSDPWHHQDLFFHSSPAHWIVSPFPLTRTRWVCHCWNAGGWMSESLSPARLAPTITSTNFRVTTTCLLRPDAAFELQRVTWLISYEVWTSVWTLCLIKWPLLCLRWFWQTVVHLFQDVVEFGKTDHDLRKRENFLQLSLIL